MTHRGETSFYSHSNRRKPLRVLCAEDDAQLAELLKRALERAGHFVQCAADGQDALERLTSDLNFFDVLITDHRMPRLSGLKLVERVRQTDFSGKIIVHSSHLPEFDATGYRAFAVDHIFTKPTQFMELLEVVERMGATAS